MEKGDTLSTWQLHAKWPCFTPYSFLGSLEAFAPLLDDGSNVTVKPNDLFPKFPNEFVACCESSLYGEGLCALSFGACSVTVPGELVQVFLERT